MTEAELMRILTRGEDSIAGLDAAAVRRLNQLLSNAASQHVRLPLSPVSHNGQAIQ